MNILVRRTTIWAFAAFFGCVSLLGPGWHCVFGHFYHGQDTCAHAHSTAGCHHHCCAAPANAARPESLPNGVDPSAPADAVDSHFASKPTIHSAQAMGHHCPLCQFFGTAQLSATFAPPALVLVASELVLSAGPSCEREAPRRYLSRAPPRALAQS